MFTTSRQLERYERGMKWRNFKEMIPFYIELFLIVAVFVILCDLAYRLSFII